MQDLAVIADAAVAAVALDPTRARILAELAEPGSATSVAAALGLPRQRVNYPLRALEDAGLVGLVTTRPRRGLTERMVQATAASYVLAPPAVGRDQADPHRIDRLSARYLVALGDRLVREVATLSRRADEAGRTLPTLGLDVDIRFANAADRDRFSHELADAVVALAGRYHDESAPAGRWHRVILAAHPRPRTERAHE